MGEKPGKGKSKYGAKKVNNTNLNDFYQHYTCNDLFWLSNLRSIPSSPI